MDWSTKFEWDNHEIDLLEVMGGVGSVSASTESSLKDGLGFFSNCCDKKEDGISVLDGSSEPFTGLELGKTTYFENSYAKNNKVLSVESKKLKLSSGQSTTPVFRCQVEGCSLDLSSAKEYHRRHKVCETHSKSPKVIVAGLERRFCQQCSRFQSLSEFDEAKRSCRKRLLNHNARRRKPQYDPTRLNSTGPYSSMYTTTESADVLTHSRGIQLSEVLTASTLACSRLLPPKSTRAEIFDQDAVDIRRALSLLSYNTWGLRELGHIYSTGPTMAQHGLQTVSQLNAQDYLQAANQQATDPRFQLFKSPFENAFQFHHNA